MSESKVKSSLMPSPNDEAIAFVYQDSPNNPPTYKVVNGKIHDSAESIPSLIRVIGLVRNKIRFLSDEEIIERFKMESRFIRPFTEDEKKQILG